MKECNVELCAVYSNGQFANPSCPQSDGYKYCLAKPGAVGAQGWDIRTMTQSECQSIYGNNQTAFQKCMTYAIMPSKDEALKEAGLSSPEELKKSNRNILLIGLLLIMVIVALVWVFYFL